MNEPLPPLPPDQVDELLSAELDGEFDAAATDLGFAPADARARLDATPGVDARRAALTSARDALAVVPELDELMAARLRAKATKAAAAEQEATGAARSRRRYRALSTVAGIAAALVVVVGVAVALNKNGSSSKQSGAASALARPPVAAPTSPTEHNKSVAVANDFGDAKDAHALAQSVASTFGASQSTSAVVPASRSAGYDYYATQVPPTCATAAQQFSGVAEPPVSSGTARLAGNPVLVYAFPKGDAHVIVVVTPDCKLVIQQVAPASKP